MKSVDSTPGTPGGMRIAFLSVGNPARRTGGYLYHRELFARLRAQGIHLDEIYAAGASLEAQLAAAPGFVAGFDPTPYDAVVVDALARAVCAPGLDAWRALRPLVALVHELPSVAAGHAQGVAELAYEAPLLRADRLIAVSADGARILSERGVAPERIVVASGGFDRLSSQRQCAEGNAQAAGGSAQFRHSALSTQHSALARSALSTQHSALARSALSTQHSALARSALSTQHSALSTQHFAPQHSSLTVLCVAQWIARKGVLELAQAWATAARTGWRLELVGEFDADPAYAREVRAALAGAPEGSVVLRGAVDDAELAAAYAAATLFAMPSRYEGYGIAFAEALAHGLPVLGCAVGPVPALVGPEAGLLVPPNDAPALAAALARLMGDPALRAHMAAAARARAATLPTWDDCAARFLAAVKAAAGLARR